MTYPEIIRSIKAKKFHPVYFLTGEEPWYIDQITSALEENVLSESEKAFNQSIYYGKDSDVLNILSTAKRFPMMSDRQLVIIKEAQLLKNIDRLGSYFENPLSSTILVVAYKYGKPDGRTDFAKKLKKNTLFFESKEIRDYQVPEWIAEYAKEKSIKIEPRAARLLAEYLGTELSRISNEIDKLCVGLKEGGQIDLNLVEKNSGISRDYNVFELNNALGRRDIFKSNLIIQNLAANPKESPPVLIMGSLISFFSKILILHSMKGASDGSIAAAIGVNQFFIKDYLLAAKNYSSQSVVKIIGRLKVADLKTKGVDSPADLKAADLLRELIFFILHD